MKRRINFVAAALILCAAGTYARTVPALTGRIIDEAGILKAEDKRTLEEYLESLENEAGIQIAVLTVRSLEGDAIEAFAHRTAEMWRLGRAGEDNGALLVIAQAERKIRIETGYGLESALTDTKCGLIIRNEIAPAFRSGDYSKGIVNGVKAMGTAAGSLLMARLRGEPEPAGTPAIPNAGRWKPTSNAAATQPCAKSCPKTSRKPM